MIKLSEPDSQIVYYAKGRFGTSTNMLEEVRILVANRAGMYPKHITDSDIVKVLTTLLDELGLKIDGSFVHAVIFGSFWQQEKGSPIQNFLVAAIGRMNTMPFKDKNGTTLVEIHPLNPNALTPLAPLH